MFKLPNPLCCCKHIFEQVNPAAHRPMSPPPFSIDVLDPELDMLGRQQIPLTNRRHTILEFFRTSRDVSSTVGPTSR